MNWCRIENNTVVEIGSFNQDPNGVLFPSSLVWVQDLSGNARFGWIYDPVSKTLSAPPPPPAPTPAQLWAAYQSSAQTALDKTDVTMTRITEAVSLGLTTLTTPDVVAWVQYRRALRTILSQSQPATIPSALPVRPAYPFGT